MADLPPAVDGVRVLVSPPASVQVLQSEGGRTVKEGFSQASYIQEERNKDESARTALCAKKVVGSKKEKKSKQPNMTAREEDAEKAQARERAQAIRHLERKNRLKWGIRLLKASKEDPDRQSLKAVGWKPTDMYKGLARLLKDEYMKGSNEALLALKVNDVFDDTEVDAFKPYLVNAYVECFRGQRIWASLKHKLEELDAESYHSEYHEAALRSMMDSPDMLQALLRKEKEILNRLQASVRQAGEGFFFGKEWVAACLKQDVGLGCAMGFLESLNSDLNIKAYTEAQAKADCAHLFSDQKSDEQRVLEVAHALVRGGEAHAEVAKSFMEDKVFLVKAYMRAACLCARSSSTFEFGLNLLEVGHKLRTKEDVAVFKEESNQYRADFGKEWIQYNPQGFSCVQLIIDQITSLGIKKELQFFVLQQAFDHMRYDMVSAWLQQGRFCRPEK